MQTRPPGGFFRVADTRALGFSTPLWFSPQSADQIADGLWLLTGIFYIPENLALAGRPWTEVIPNAVCTLEGMMLQGRRGPVHLNFSWQCADEEIQSAAKTLADKFRASMLGRLFSGWRL